MICNCLTFYSRSRFFSQGAQVVVTARRKERIERVAEDIGAAGGDAFAVECDVTKVESVDKMLKAALDKYGKVNAAFLNSGEKHCHREISNATCTRVSLIMFELRTFVCLDSNKENIFGESVRRIHKKHRLKHFKTHLIPFY